MPRMAWPARRSGSSRRPGTPLRGAMGVLWVLMLVYAGYFSALSIRQHDAFLTHKADLGHFDQPMWNTLHGRLLVRTQQGEQLTRLTDHFEPILIPLSLSFLLWDDVRVLLVLQSVVVALGALPLFWLTRDELRAAGYSLGIAEVVGLVLAIVYLLFPALQAANLTEFHAAPLMVAPMLLALYYARQGRYAPMWGWALAVMAVKEEMPLLTLMLGVWLVLARREWKQGTALAAVSLLWFSVATFVIVPHYAPLKYGVDESIYFQRYGELGDSPLDVARSLFTRPGLAWEIATQPARVHYLLGLLLSAGLVLPLLAPEILLLSAPSLAANLLSSYEAMYSGVYHYSAPVVPFLAAAAAVGLGRVGRWARKSRHHAAITMGAAGMLLAVSVVYHAVHGYTPAARLFFWPEVTDHHRLLERRFAPQIPEDAVLSTTAPLFPHLDHRERIHQFPRVEDAGWVLLDAGSFAEMHPADMRRAYEDLIAGGAWCIVDAADGYVLLERRAGAAEGSEACDTELPDAFYNFARAGDREPEYRVQADYGPIRLLGYDVTSVRQWQRVGVRLYWTRITGEESGMPDGDLRIYPFWLGPGGVVLQTADERPLVEPYWYPVEQWRIGEVVVTEMLPWDIGAEFRLGVAVLDAGGNRVQVESLGAPDRPVYAMDGASWLRMPAFRWVDGKVRPVDESAGLRHPLAAQFGSSIVLSGYDLDPVAPGPGQDLAVWLTWARAGQALDRELTVFVHLLDEGGERVAQGDGVPGYLGALPTTLWEPGVPLLDRHVVPLPAGLAPGRYTLMIGWYDPETGGRLTLSSGEDVLSLAEITVP